MKLIKLGFFSVIILFTLVTCIGLLFPSKVIVSRAVDISQSPDSVYVYLKDLYGWKQWVSGMQQQTVNSPIETKIGASTIKVLSSNPTEIIGEWVEKNGDVQKTTISLISSQNKTVVHWQFEQNLKWYPWQRFGSMVNDKVIGSMMESNLANLVKLVEHK
jgi:carbon monoxide dehydrogenase subunit G